MYNASHKNIGCLLNTIDSIGKIFSYVKTFNGADELNSDSISFDTTLMNFIVIGEMADKLSDEFKESTDSMFNWFKIKWLQN